MKQKTLNEIRQSKEYQQAKGHAAVALEEIKASKNPFERHLHIDVVKNKIVESLKHQMYDIIFESVNKEMHKFYVFQEDNYLTEAGMDMFEEHWFEFYHDHHGDILWRVMQNITN